MLKKGFALLCAGAMLLCGCSEKDYDTKVVSGDTSENHTGDEEFEVFKDIGKSYGLFDNTRVVNAYLNGETDGLTDFEEEIFNEAKRVLDELKKDCKTDLELELAVHDYIVGSSTYDKQAISVLETPQENSENPYGILFNKTGICLGYTTAFQLFMDMAQIPCITVYSQDEDGDEHAWNQVEIDGKWYYVDCTWDDPVPENEGRAPYHTYFNVTEEFMEESGHCWNKEDCHKADSYDASFYLADYYQAEDKSELQEIVDQAVSQGKMDFVIKTQDQLIELSDYFVSHKKGVFVGGQIEFDGSWYTLLMRY